MSIFLKVNKVYLKVSKIKWPDTAFFYNYPVLMYKINPIQAKSYVFK